MRFLVALLISLPLTVLGASSEYDNPKQADQEIIESCEMEGVSLGFQAAELKTFVEECIVDFLDTTMDITPTPKSGQK